MMSPEEFRKQAAQAQEAEALLTVMKKHLTPYKDYMGINIDNLNIITACGYGILICMTYQKDTAENMRKVIAAVGDDNK